MALFEPSRLGSNGKAGRILGPPGSGIDVHIDVIENVKRSHEWRRTETALERGAALTVHRQRVPETMQMSIAVSNMPPDALALITGRWERDHAAKTYARLLAAQEYDQELRVWLGESFARTPAGIQVWVLDNIDGPEEDGAMTVAAGVLRATLTFGESPRFATVFAANLPDVTDSLADVVGDNVERGRQSTTSTTTAVTPWP